MLRIFIFPLMVMSALACASPVNWLVEFVEPMPSISGDGFARVQIPMPEGAELLALEWTGEQLHVHASIDPDQPMVWRVVQMQTADSPQVIPTNRYLGLLRHGKIAIHAFDMGQFAQPIPARPGTKNASDEAPLRSTSK